MDNKHVSFLIVTFLCLAFTYAGYLVDPIISVCGAFLWGTLWCRAISVFYGESE